MIGYRIPRWAPAGLLLLASGCAPDQLVRPGEELALKPALLIGRGTLVTGGGFKDGGVDGFVGSLPLGWDYDSYTPTANSGSPNQCYVSNECGAASAASRYPGGIGRFADVGFVTTSNFTTGDVHHPAYDRDASPTNPVFVDVSGVSTSIVVPTPNSAGGYRFRAQVALLTAWLDPLVDDQATVTVTGPGTNHTWNFSTTQLSGTGCGAVTLRDLQGQIDTPIEFTRCHQSLVPLSLALPGPGTYTISLKVTEKVGGRAIDKNEGTTLVVKDVEVEFFPAAVEGSVTMLDAGLTNDAVLCDGNDAACLALPQAIDCGPGATALGCFNSQSLNRAWWNPSWDVSGTGCAAVPAQANLVVGASVAVRCPDDGNPAPRFSGTFLFYPGQGPAPLQTDFVAEPTPIAVTNAAPVIASASVPATATVGVAINASIQFTDLGVLDTHTATFDWGDGTSSTVTGGFPAPNSAAASHSYSAPGSFTVVINLVDDDGGQAASVSKSITVTAGSNGPGIAGTGAFESPRGALVATPALSGLATLTLDCSQAAAGAKGSVRMTLGAGLDLIGSTVTSLTIREGLVTCAGTGTLNGTAARFTVIVADRAGGDLVRVRVTRLNGQVLYDSEPSRPFPAIPQRKLLSGNYLVT